MSTLQRASRVSPDLRDRWTAAGHRTGEQLSHLLEDSARRWPTRIAALTASGSVTFADLAHESSRVARALLDLGVRGGDVVCWMLPTGPKAIAVAAAVWRVGAVSSPIVPQYGPAEITDIVAQVRPTVVITTAAASRRDHPGELDAACEAAGLAPARLLAEGSRAGWRSLSSWEGGSLPDGLGRTDVDDTCLVLFTSGTEAGPKGVLHSVAAVTHELRSTITGWGLTFRDRMVMASPMTHITGLLQGFMIPARVGAASILMDRWDADACVDLIETHGATYMAGATPFLRELTAAYTHRGLDRSSLTQYCCGGAAVPPALIRQVQDLGIAAYRAWGMTELPTATLPNELDSLDDRAETDGPLAPGVEIRVVGDDGSDLPLGHAGELLLRGPEMMLGYLDDERDAAVFTDGDWLRTGDIGLVDETGRVRVTGRTKDIINRGGEKLSAREIELAVGKHPDVDAVAVIAVPGGRLGERVGAVVVSSRADLDVADLGRTVTDGGLSRQKQPEIVAVVQALPTNATGKIDRRAVLQILTAAAKEPEGRS